MSFNSLENGNFFLVFFSNGLWGFLIKDFLLLFFSFELNNAFFVKFVLFEHQFFNFFVQKAEFFTSHLNFLGWNFLFFFFFNFDLFLLNWVQSFIDDVCQWFFAWFKVSFFFFFLSDNFRFVDSVLVGDEPNFGIFLFSTHANFARFIFSFVKVSTAVTLPSLKEFQVILRVNKDINVWVFGHGF